MPKDQIEEEWERRGVVEMERVLTYLVPSRDAERLKSWIQRKHRQEEKETADRSIAEVKRTADASERAAAAAESSARSARRALWYSVVSIVVALLALFASFGMKGGE